MPVQTLPVIPISHWACSYRKKTVSGYRKEPLKTRCRSQKVHQKHEKGVDPHVTYHPKKMSHLWARFNAPQRGSSRAKGAGQGYFRQRHLFFLYILRKHLQYLQKTRAVSSRMGDILSRKRPEMSTMFRRGKTK